jgi:hypothetical protein
VRRATHNLAETIRRLVYHILCACFICVQ